MQRVCGAFHACLMKFKEMVPPESFFGEVEPEIVSTFLGHCLEQNDSYCKHPLWRTILRFMHRHADAELTSLLSDTAPPPNPSAIDLFKRHLEKYNSKAPEYFINWPCLHVSPANTSTLFACCASDCRSLRREPQRPRSLLDVVLNTTKHSFDIPPQHTH